MARDLGETASGRALNKIPLNIDKSVYIVFGNCCNSVPQNIKIQTNGKMINRQKDFK